MADLFSAFRGTKEGQSILALAVYHVTLIQNNQYATSAYLEVGCPTPFSACHLPSSASFSALQPACLSKLQFPRKSPGIPGLPLWQSASSCLSRPTCWSLLGRDSCLG